MIPNWFVSLFLTDSGDACIFFPIDAQASGVNCGSMSLSNTFCIGWQGIKIAGLDTFANLYGTPFPSPSPTSQLQTHTLYTGKTRRHVKMSLGRPAAALFPGLTAADTHNYLTASTTSGRIMYRSEHTHAHTHAAHKRAHVFPFPHLLVLVRVSAPLYGSLRGSSVHSPQSFL